MMTKHRGFDVRFVEASDKWVCGDLGFEHASLAQLKKLIDKEHKERRKCDVPALYMSMDHWRETPQVHAVRIKLIRENGRKADIVLTKAGKVGRFTRKAGEREQVDMDSLYPLAARAQIMRYVQAKRAENAAEAAREREQEKLSDLRLTAQAVREAMVQMADENT